MAEDGIQDYASAKRKAARQAGVSETGELPTNQEIEAELRAYQALYQANAQPVVLRRLREIALRAMEFLAPFNPHLTGSVLTGTAGAHSDVNLQVFADSAKEFEIFLLNRNMPFTSGTRIYRLGDRGLPIPVFKLTCEETIVLVAVFEWNDLRVTQKYKSDGRLVERARVEEVRALLQGGLGSSLNP